MTPRTFVSHVALHPSVHYPPPQTRIVVPDFTIIGFPCALSHHTPLPLKTLMAEILWPYSAVTRPISSPRHLYNTINEVSSLFIYAFQCISTMHVRTFLKLVVIPAPYCSLYPCALYALSSGLNAITTRTPMDTR